jgi:4'-phosphopantetheinyl transferase
MAATTTLDRNEIAVWWMATDAIGPADLHRWLGILDQEERDRAARFYFDIDRREFIAAHALLRTMLAFYLNRPALQWQFVSDAEGKPRIDPRDGACECPFSISHTRGLVAAALAADGAVGIDAEHIDPRKADFAMAEAYFASAEVQLLRATPASEQNLCFFRLWTLKEAYVKATGTGLSTPLKSFAFAFEPIRIQFEPGGAERVAEWQFAILPTTDRHVLSVAAGHHASAVRMSPRAVAPWNIPVP